MCGDMKFRITFQRTRVHKVLAESEEDPDFEQFMDPILVSCLASLI